MNAYCRSQTRNKKRNKKEKKSTKKLHHISRWRQRRRRLGGGGGGGNSSARRSDPQQQQHHAPPTHLAPKLPETPPPEKREWGPPDNNAKKRKTPSNHPWILFMQMYVERENAKLLPGQAKFRYFKSLREAGKEYKEKVIKTMPALDPAIKDKEQIGMHKCAHVVAYFKAGAA